MNKNIIIWLAGITVILIILITVLITFSYTKSTILNNSQSGYFRMEGQNIQRSFNGSRNNMKNQKGSGEMGNSKRGQGIFRQQHENIEKEADN